MFLLFFIFQSIQNSNAKFKNKMWNETSSKCRASAVKNLTINLHFLPSFIKSQKLLYYELCYFYFSSHINCKLLAHSAQSNLAVSIHIPMSFYFVFPCDHIFVICGSNDMRMKQYNELNNMYLLNYQYLICKPMFKTRIKNYNRKWFFFFRQGA